MIRFIIHGEPVAKGRPKFSNRGGYVKAYTPQKTLNYENLIKVSYDTQVEDKTKLEGEIFAEILAFFPIPKSTSKKKSLQMDSGEIMHTKKSDCDNIAKIVLDALNNIAYDDDRQVCSLTVKKFYSTYPRVEVSLWERKEIFLEV